MKSINKRLLITLLAVAVMGIITSCKKDNDLPNNGEPRIRYIRATNAASADSLLVGAAQGNLVAIVGENLQDVSEVWFNDQRRFLSPTYITSTTVMVRVPTPIPKEITNKLKMIFFSGKTLLYD